MALKMENCNVWIKFEAKRQNCLFKLRIQDLPKNRMDDFITFILHHYIRDEAFHKTAGIYTSQKAIEEYKRILMKRYELNPPHITICCRDRGSDDVDEILATSTVQLMTSKNCTDKDLSQLQNKEVRDFFNIINVLSPKLQSLKDKYEWYYCDRGIIVHPDYRILGIATQLTKQRRLLCQEHKVPMICAWITSIGTQKAAERDGWDAVDEVTLEELDNLTGLNFAKDVPTYKLMMATVDY